MSGCFTGPYVSAYDPPIDCAVEVYKRQDTDPAPPKAWVIRGGQMVDVTGTVDAIDAPDLGLTVYTVDCDGNPVSHTRNQLLFDHYLMHLSGAQVDEMLYIDGNLAGTMRAAGGACDGFATLPEPECSGMYDWSICDGSDGSGSGATPPENDDTGCSAAGASNFSGLCVAFALLAMRRRKK